MQNRLLDNMRLALQRPMTLGELTKALQEMAKQRSPRPDGITVEFYLALWPVIGQQYLKMIQESINMSCLPLGVTNGIITLLHKRGIMNSLN